MCACGADADVALFYISSEGSKNYGLLDATLGAKTVLLYLLPKHLAQSYI
jgi:hypothetical protein